MFYKSTRGSDEKITSAEAIKRGIAPDGGLYLPDEIPFLSEAALQSMIELDYPKRAAEIIYMFLSDMYTKEELLADCEAAYAESRFPGGAAQLSKVGPKMRILELWHGPTCAFKDMALQLMPRLLSKALVKTGEQRKAFILVATSGDTGKAALEGYKDVENTEILVYYPRDGVSAMQKKQMATQEGKNVHVRSVIGNFDDAQTGVKVIFGDPSLGEEMSRRGYVLSSANSINWGRLVPQVVYYISAYCDLVKDGDVKFGEEINVTVPTGNFGNILAAYIAKEMGLPINTLLCASNKNNILTDFFTTGTYDRNRQFFTTVSPSMDILISSNLERLLCLKCGEQRTTELMTELKKNGKYSLTEDEFRLVKRGFEASYCDEEKTSETIHHVYHHYNYLCDTHTAVAVSCAEEFIEKLDTNRVMLTVSTASPYKFAPAVYKAVTGENAPDEVSAIALLSSKTKTPVPMPISSVLEKNIRFDPENSVKADAMAEAMLSVCGKVED